MDEFKKEIRPEMFRYVREKGVVSITDIAKTLDLQEYQVTDILHVSSLYSRSGPNNSIITIKGLGVDRCLVCAMTNDSSSVMMRVPHSYFTDLRPIIKLSEGVRGHKNCYSDIGLIFTFEGLTCYTCDSWYGESSAGELVREGCHKFGTNKKIVGVAGQDNACNFYYPDSAARLSGFNGYKISRGIWGKTEPIVREKTAEGYRNLVKLLEKNKLLLGIETE